MNRTQAHIRRAFTFAELLIVISILAIISALLVPLASSDNATGVRAAAELLAADIEDVQARSLAEPNKASCLVPYEDGSGWHIAHMDDSALPIDGIDGQPLTRQFGSGVLAGCSGVTFTPPVLPPNGLGFDDQGAPVALAGAITFLLEADEGSLVLGVEVSAATGRVSINRR